MKIRTQEVARALGTAPSKARITEAGIAQDEVVRRALEDTSHSHVFREEVEVKGVRVSVYDIPTLRKKMLVYTAHDGNAYRGYIADADYGGPEHAAAAEARGQAALDDLNKTRITMLLIELEKAGRIGNKDDLFEDELDLIERVAEQRGLKFVRDGLKTRKSAVSPEARKTAEVRKAAKALGGKALKGSAAQKSWAEKIRAGVLRAVDADVAETLLTEERFEHSKWWIDNRRIFEDTLWKHNFMNNVRRGAL